jgi:FtsP/CotA-like multicopper oxidase with cupredoxin domain
MNYRLRRAIQQILLAGSTAAFAAGTLAAVGQQNPPPGPGHVPDYFGVVPNYATSPQPVLTQVVFNSDVVSGTGASATATLGASGAIAGVNLTAGGSGYVSPVVNIIDQPTGSGATASVVMAGGISGINLVDPGAECTQASAVTFTDPNGTGSGASATVTLDSSNNITGFTIVAPGSGYSTGTTVNIACDGTAASATVTVAPGTPGEILGITISNPGQSYSPSAHVVFHDPQATPGIGASANVAVDANGVITGFTDIVPGSGYSGGTTVTIEDVATGSGATATAIAKRVNRIPGVITAINVTSGGTGYRSPMLEITDANATGGSGAIAVATTYDYANDVQTDKIMDVQILNPGSGYNADATVTINGGPGVTPVTVTPIIDNGTITGFEEIPSPTNVVANFAGIGSGFKTPIANSGIRKFVDSLSTLNSQNNLGQQMPIAVADTTTFPGSDYYEIAETEYTQKLHSDLPATHLRGYKQLNAPAGNAAGTNQYLGPVIIAQKDRPVRVKLVNQLSKGDAGKLPIPVDTTYMGADSVADTDNRTALHLHGGNTPWISDGTPRQWVKPAGEVGPNKGETARNVPDMWFDASGNVVPAASVPTDPAAAGLSNNPGDGALTFFYTNEQSARLMFYHDHAEGTTRLNVYDGMAAGYILQDPTEQAMVDNGILPPLEDTIPLVIQEKTFVPNNTQPVLNFYGPFASALQSQDPTWRWGTTGSAATGLNGNGDLWVPHVFMPNQNPGDVSGANAVGRWDYGAWFWPPFVNLQNGPIANPYYDPACNTTTSYCEGAEIPGVPNGSLQAVLSNGIAGGVPDATKGGAITESPSGTPEAFNDTPLVNGTAYPFINVDPKKYRLRILSVGNDRMLNLSMVMAASKNSVDTTADGNTGTANNTILCDGTTGVDPADCTEVKMVPFDKAQNTAKPFPTHWYTAQKGGVTFDGRPSGVFDPATRGPEMVQIGTEGGFLAAPVEIKNQPVNYEYNPKNILIGNIKEHALLLGPAERADVLVDFSNFAGSTLILYNDAGAPVPAWDLRLDYYTGNFDNTDTGGAFSVIPGYGPNSRTIMQIRVSGSGGSHPVDDKGGINMATLTTAVQSAFKTSQEPIIVPQSVYNGVYGMSFPDALGADLSRIGDHSLTYRPYDAGTGSLLPAVKLELEPKTIIEDWTMNWGRMNALLGTEVPHTTAINQTSIPQAFIDPPTDLVKITPNDNMVPISGTLPDGTQLWKVTHNGVDSHAIHFHLFHVQIVNRVGWDGAVYPPAANELGWKDTVLMHPLSDTVVALRPMTMTALPFKVPNSHRLLDPAQAANASSTDFFNFNPLDGNASDVTNKEVNYGWEYLWHCHILGHEENDMMRTIAVAQPPEAPINLAATTVGNSVKLDWTDDSIISNWVTIQRSTSPSFATVDAAFNVVEPECANQAGCARTYTDTTAPAATSVYYRIMANNTVGAGDGRLDQPRDAGGIYTKYLSDLSGNIQSLTPNFAGYANVTANSNWTAVSRLVSPVATVTAGPLAFGDQLINASSAAQTVTVSNTGTGNLVISGVALTTGTNYATVNNCPATLAPAASCNISVTFKPTATGNNLADTLTITDNSSTGSTQTVSLTGNGTAPIAGVSLSTLPSFGNVNVGATSAAQTVTLSNTGTAPLTIASIVAPAQFAQTNNCGASLAVGANCVVNVTFNPTVAGGTPANTNLTITDNSNGVPSTQTVSLSGTGVQALVLNAPTGLTASVSGTGTTRSVSLAWTDTSIGETGYVVQRATTTISATGVVSSGAFATITTSSGVLAANAVGVINTAVPQNGLYAYRVYAVNGATNGPITTVYAWTGAAMTIPGQPAASSAANRTATSINVNWAVSTPATNDITGYVVQRCSSGVTYTGTTPTALQQFAAGVVCALSTSSWTPPVAITTAGSAGNSYNNTGLPAKTLYGYRIIATNTLTGVSSGNSAARILWTN